MAMADPESFSWARLLFATATVAGLLAALAFVLKFFASRGARLASNGVRRLSIVESLPLDLRRRLVIVRCDGKDHLLLLGQNNDCALGELSRPPDGESP